MKNAVRPEVRVGYLLKNIQSRTFARVSFHYTQTAYVEQQKKHKTRTVPLVGSSPSPDSMRIKFSTSAMKTRRRHSRGQKRQSIDNKLEKGNKYDITL